MMVVLVLLLQWLFFGFLVFEISLDSYNYIVSTKHLPHKTPTIYVHMCCRLFLVERTSFEVVNQNDMQLAFCLFKKHFPH